ncbi:MAG: Tox-REase-5 domain-containing protein [Anaerocolumna sp.]
METAEKNAADREYVYDGWNWEDELQNNISETISEIPSELTTYERRMIIDGIIIFEASELQDKYRSVYTYSDNIISKYITERGFHQQLVPLFTEYPDINNPNTENKYLRAFLDGFLLGLDYGLLYASMDWAYTYTYSNVKSLSGQWKKVNESMSDFSRKYQSQITGREGEVWLQNGVKFDGMKDGILLDAKGKYAQFVNKSTGIFYDWFTGQKSLVTQARNQIAAADGAKIQWYFAEESALEAVENLFADYEIDGIELIFQALQ